ncbi:WD repeat-containing protein 1 [Hondaea fermentalgiana]|uniref:WD repeat-containing protein 1 n=1 Tax=Hondaea fermentalgiana TaxID=2315210 RepID=A0A2R5GM91_9STRA|nr:WD repeat-containing protein 1 [Hondaea fermentalgiana]|eukprot:GBG32000.1 WD repeat-containing protein 1 [Hondaea fermentalgiana]
MGEHDDDELSVGSAATLDPDVQAASQTNVKEATDLAPTEVQDAAIPESQDAVEASQDASAIPDTLLEETQNSMHAMDLEDTSMEATQQVLASQSQGDDEIDDEDEVLVTVAKTKSDADKKKQQQSSYDENEDEANDHNESISYNVVHGDDDDDDDDAEMLAMQQELDADDALEMSQSQDDNEESDQIGRKTNKTQPETTVQSPNNKSNSANNDEDADIMETLDVGEEMESTREAKGGAIFGEPSDKQPAHVSRVVLPPGRAGLAVSADASHAFAAGSLGVRLLDVNKREVEKDLVEIEDALCVDVHPAGDLVACGAKNGQVRLVRSPSGELKELLHRAPGPVRDVSFSPSGEHLAVALDENVIRVIELAKPAAFKELKGHSAAVKALSWAPQGDLLASAATNGQVIIWSVRDSKALKKLARGTVLADTVEDPDKTEPVQLAWETSGKVLALTAAEGIILLSRDTWSQKIMAPCGGSGSAKKETVPTALAWSPNGVYLLFANARGEIRLLDTRKNADAGTRLDKFDLSSIANQYASPVQRIVWPSRRRGALALSMDGNVHWFASLIPEGLDDALNTPTSSSSSSSSSSSKESGTQIESENASAGDKEQTADNAEGGVSKKQGSSQEDGEENIDGNNEAGDVDSVDGDDHHMGDELDMNDDLDDQDEGTGLYGGPTSAGGLVSSQQLDARIKRAIEDAQPAQFQRQGVLMPGATPDSEERRFLAWNSVGSVTLRTEETHNSVEIDFANTVDHRRVRFSDHYGFTMAALGESGALFATPGELGEANSGALARPYGSSSNDPSKGPASATSRKNGDDTDWDPGLPEDDMQEELRARQSEHGLLQTYMDLAEQADAAGVAPEKLLGGATSKNSTLADRMEARYGTCSTLFYKSFDSRSNNADWTARLPVSEKARAVAAGASFAAVATNRRTLRIFRPSGLQEAPLVLPGPILSMSGAGVFLFVVYHTGAPSADGTQHMGFQLIDVGVEGAAGGGITSIAASGRLPMPHGEPKPLKWVGLCDKSMGFMPACMDSKGTLMVLSKAVAWNWVPVLDENTLRRSKHDVLWPVSIQLGKLNGILLKGKGAHAGFPEIYPRPVLTSFDLSVPLAGLNLSTGSLKYKLEEETVRSHLVLEQLKWVAKAIPDTTADVDALRLGDQKLLEAEAQLDAGVLKHMILAVKLNRSARAFGLVKRLRLDRSLQIAHQQAQQAGADLNLLQRIERLIAIREQAARLAEDDGDDASSSDEDGEEDDDMSGDDADFGVVEPTETRQRQRRTPVNKMRKRLAAQAPASALRTLSIQEPSDSEDDLRSEASYEDDRRSKIKHRVNASSASVASSPGSSEATSDPPVLASEMSSPSTQMKKKRNPFALSKKASENTETSANGQSIMSAFKKAPVLTPKLNRQSTFTQEALSTKPKKPTSASKRRRL